MNRDYSYALSRIATHPEISELLNNRTRIRPHRYCPPVRLPAPMSAYMRMPACLHTCLFAWPSAVFVFTSMRYNLTSLGRILNLKVNLWFRVYIYVV